MRWWIEYEKGPAIRYLSHLDMVRLWERLFRRSGLPLQLTQGFNPHLKISLGTVLPVGLWGRREYLDVKLGGDIEPEELCSRLRAVAPPGIEIRRARRLARELPSLMAVIDTSIYRFKYPASLETAIRKVAERMERASEIRVIRPKDRKEVNIRPGIIRIKCIPGADEFILEFTVFSGGRETVRFSELLPALDEMGLQRKKIVDYWREGNYVRTNDQLIDPMELD